MVVTRDLHYIHHSDILIAASAACSKAPLAAAMRGSDAFDASLSIRALSPVGIGLVSGDCEHCDSLFKGMLPQLTLMLIQKHIVVSIYLSSVVFVKP